MSEETTARRRWPWSAPRTLGVAGPLIAFLWIAMDPDTRALLVGCVVALVDGARSTALLAAVDAGTWLTALGVAARVMALAGPVLRALLLGPRWRFAWAPLLAVAWVGLLGMSLPAVATVLAWCVLIVASVAAWLAASRPRLRAAVFLPWVLALEPALGHSPLSDDAWPPGRLSARCAENEGSRPRNLSPAAEGTHYYAVTPFNRDLLLLTGERHSFWVERDAQGSLELGPAVRPTANLWQGCVRDGKAWVTARGVGVCEVAPPSSEDPVPQQRCHDAPGSPALGIELDYVDALCPADRGTIYASQLLRGGYLEVDPRTDVSVWHPITHGFNLQMVMRRDGRIVAITSGRMLVFDPTTDRVIEEHAAGTVAMGVDVCTQDDTVAVTDFAGRVRLFELGPDGRYQFRAGAFLAAPRRVAFSPGCDRLAVTSGDDRRVFILRRDGLTVERTYHVGPGLRDVVFLDDTHAAIADACTVTVLDAGPR